MYATSWVLTMKGEGQIFLKINCFKLSPPTGKRTQVINLKGKD